jgi:hypothetical protein
MNANKNSGFMNSILPVSSNARNNFANNKNFSNSSVNANSSGFMSSLSTISILIGVVVIVILTSLLYVYKKELTDIWSNAEEIVKGYFYPAAPAPAPDSTGSDASGNKDHTEVTNASSMSNNPAPAGASILDKILPGGEVFNVSSNRYTYYDAEPLCKALGAELATYDQVKAAWNKGADWCNYGWVKGQMAVFPTAEDTYQKLQAGPEDQRMACGRPGMNGGYFDNPEMRFGVTCVGNKPPQNKHDEAQVAKGAPVSPDALAFDKKVSQFKSEAQHIGILPFNTGAWSS